MVKTEWTPYEWKYPNVLSYRCQYSFNKKKINEMKMGYQKTQLGINTFFVASAVFSRSIRNACCVVGCGGHVGSYGSG